MEVALVIVGVIFFIILWDDDNNDIDSGMDLRMKDSTFWEDYVD